ncbi:MAG: tripartite tricarboxylate transporter substrate binding protein [Hyphomicrobiales bacterium]|nr:tripartite tricarboxylate transporter substrate binding protein [Hyphomicrobiales bacterium]
MVAISLLAGGAAAQPYPSKTIRFVLPLSPGSPIDVIARIVAPSLSTRLKQPVVVENRPGGGTTIGTKAVATAVPDGYTLLFASATHTLSPALIKNPGFDAIKDFTAVATVGSGAWVLVVEPSLPVKSVQELVAYAKANPGKLNWGFGRNAGPHLLGELFVLATGIDVNRIPYKSGNDAVPDMLGGRVQMNFGTVAALSQLVSEGKLRALAVTGQTRNAEFPGVPTMKEIGFPRLTRGFWAGLLAPAGTPQPIVMKLNAETNAALATPEMRASLAKIGVEPGGGSPQDFAALIADEIDAWKAAAKAAGIVPE